MKKVRRESVAFKDTEYQLRRILCVRDNKRVGAPLILLGEDEDRVAKKGFVGTLNKEKYGCGPRFSHV